jgi:2-polyprenyl-6-methoxyphenol hydroxylase-like FAD-dependent oxidoreductase
MTLIKTTCCIIGGGPAGMMLGLLLARAGVPIVVLEKHRILRDFRGDTVHPSTLEMMHELGLLEEFLKIPIQRCGKCRCKSETTASSSGHFGRFQHSAAGGDGGAVRHRVRAIFLFASLISKPGRSARSHL